jgi:hypothetical protein
LAPLLEELELDQPALVTLAMLAEIAERTGLAQDAQTLATRLRAHGWLLPMRTKGVWEFAPAARAGRYGSGNQLLELRATLLRRPDLGAVAAFDSASWLLGLAGRSPTRDVVALPDGVTIPPALRAYRIVRMTMALEPVWRLDVPVWREESLLVAMAARPDSYRDWPNVPEWLPRATRGAGPEGLAQELAGRPRSAWARLAYLLRRGGAEGQIDAILSDAPAGKGPFYLGPRSSGGHHDATTDVVDSLLATQHGPSHRRGSGPHTTEPPANDAAARPGAAPPRAGPRRGARKAEGR